MIKTPIVIERTYEATLQELWDLWTTKEGFESWWGPQGFRVDVHAIEPKNGGRLSYDMIAATPETIAAMKEMGHAASHATHGTFTQVAPLQRLVLVHIIDFVPGVKPYENTIVVEFVPQGKNSKMIVTLHGMHNDEFTGMQLEGFTSQLTKLDKPYRVQKP